MPGTTDHFFAEFDDAITQQLNAFFTASIQKSAALHPRYELLWRELARVTQNGGKRLRPKMVLLAYDAFDGKDPDNIIPVATALEVLHSSLLIHDDIIDRELVRRGELNVSGMYEHAHYANVADDQLRRHYSDGAALLGGDLLLFATLNLIDSAQLDGPVRDRIHALIHRIIFEVVGGQLLDSEAAIVNGTVIDALTVAHYKTASYSFAGPLLTGALLAEAADADLKQLENFATNLGIAYQLHDDLLSVFGDEQVTGKSTSSDLREGKRTFLVEQFMQTAHADDAKAFQTLFGNSDLSHHDAERLKALLKSNGAIEKTETRIAHYKQAAKDALEQLRLSDVSKVKFKQLISISLNRTA